MPKRISEKDKREIYIAHKIGEKSNGLSVYSEIVCTECQFTTFSGTKAVNEYGTQLGYNAIALFEYNEISKYINETTKFWFGLKPTNSSEDNNYNVVSVSSKQDGLIVVYLNSVTQNANCIWYLYNNTILRFDCKFDYDTLTVTVDDNTYMPIKYDTTVWKVEPKSTATTTGRIMLLKITDIENAKKYKFVEGSI